MRCARGFSALAALTGLLIVSTPTPSAGQSGWVVDVAGERSSVTIGAIETIWSTERVQVGWVRPEAGGWFARVERHDRFGRSDLVFGANGYRRLGVWTIAAGAAGTSDADFWFRRSLDVELSRTLVGTLVASVGYRDMEFVSTGVRQVQPALTLYHRKGDLQGRLFVTRNRVRDGSSLTGLVTGTYQASPRIGVSASVARGDRIFDIGSIATGTARAWMARGSVRVGLGSRTALDVGLGLAHEEPRFDQRTLSVSVRRSF